MFTRASLSDDTAAMIRNALGAVFACAIVYGGWMLWELVFFELYPVHHGGAGLTFTAVSRAILNGFLPYKDLFEFKPPGIFLVGAVSLWLFDDNRLGNAVQALSDIGIVVMLLIPALQECRRKKWKPGWNEWVLAAAGAITGILITLYTGTRSGHFQTESIGSFMAIAFLVTVAHRITLPLLRLLGAALLLVGAVGMKEPFVLMIFAAVLVLFPVRAFPRMYLLPLGVAAMIGVALLFVLGYLEPYFTIYLPEIMTGRSSFNPYPLWTLAFNAHFALKDLFAFSPALVIGMAILWIASLISMTNTWKRPQALMALAALVVSSMALYIVGAYAVTSRQILQTSFYQSPKPTDVLFLPVMAVAIAFCITAWLSVRKALNTKDATLLLGALLQHWLALMLTFIGIVVQGGYPQHLGTIAPLLAALFFSVAYRALSDTHHASPQWLTFQSATVVLAAGMFFIPLPNYAPVLEQQIADEKAAQSQAAQIDGIMSACGYERYVILGNAEGVVPYAYTQHSPFGPAFLRTAFTFPVAWRIPPIAYIQDTYREHLHETDFVIATKIVSNGVQMIDGVDIPDDVWEYYSENFSAVPPPCAAPFHEEGIMAFRFRKK